MISQRPHIPHPEGKGVLKTRYKAIVKVPKDIPLAKDANLKIVGKADQYYMLVKDRSAPAYDLPGGSADFGMQLTREGKWRNYKPGELTGSHAIASQLKGKTGLWLENGQFLGTYLGKVHSHSLAGARIYEGIASGKLDRLGAYKKYQEKVFGYKTPEVSDIVLWDGKTKLPKDVEVMPSTVDIYKTNPAIKTSNMNIYKGDSVLLKVRDTAFAKRITQGKELSPDKLAKVTANMEIKALKRLKSELAKPPEASVLDFLRGTPDIKTPSDLILGRANRPGL